MFTRQEYLNDESHRIGASSAERTSAHRRYYGQFVDARTIAVVVQFIGADRLRASKDPHMNDIPLPLWDRLAPNLPGSGKFKDAGDYYTLAGGVCLAKEAARQWLESQS